MAHENEKGTIPSSLDKTAKPSEAQQRAAARRDMPETAAALDSLGQLREILFGAIQRDLERRLTRADAHLAAKAHELEQESRRRIEVLEAHLRQETESIAGRLERELTDRAENARAVGREHRESIAALEQRVVKAEEAIVRSQRELRQQLLAQAKAFLDEIQQLRHELAATLERELGLAEREEAEYGEEERPAP